MEPLYKLYIDIDTEIIYMIHDIIRILTIQIITHIMVCINNSSVIFLNSIFIQTTIFLCISIMTYWLIIHKLFSIENNNKHDLRK